MTQPELSTATLSSQPTYEPVSTTKHLDTPLEEIEATFEVGRTVSYIASNGFRRIALQFPDELLPASTRVSGLLKQGIDDHHITGDLESLKPASQGTDGPRQTSDDVKFYILADTSYGSCCVDEIAAEHADADCIIHYGRACLSPYVVFFFVLAAVFLMVSSLTGT